MILLSSFIHSLNRTSFVNAALQINQQLMRDRNCSKCYRTTFYSKLTKSWTKKINKLSSTAKKCLTSTFLNPLHPLHSTTLIHDLNFHLEKKKFSQVNNQHNSIQYSGKKQKCKIFNISGKIQFFSLQIFFNCQSFGVHDIHQVHKFSKNLFFLMILLHRTDP